MLLPSAMMNKAAVAEILNCNTLTSTYGLVLSRTESEELVEARSEALSSTGRIEFSGGIINKLIIAFCDSPFLSQYNYSETLNELIETFYYYKNETLDEISDDDLILWMKCFFDKSCQGSIELLQNRELEALARSIRYGTSYCESPSDVADHFFDDNNDDEENDYE